MFNEMMPMSQGGGGGAEVNAVKIAGISSTTSISPTLLPTNLSGVGFSKLVMVHGTKSGGAKTVTVATPSKAKAIVVCIGNLFLTYNTETNACLRIASDADVTSSTLIASVTASANSVTFTIDNFASSENYEIILLCE